MRKCSKCSDGGVTPYVYGTLNVPIGRPHRRPAIERAHTGGGVCSARYGRFPAGEEIIEFLRCRPGAHHV